MTLRVPPTDAPVADRAAVAACRSISRRHGVSYYWAARLLGREQRRHVYALYAFCRRADDVVDTTDGDVAGRGDELRRLHERLRRVVAGGYDPDPVVRGVGCTVVRYALNGDLFDRFFGAMAADLMTTSYATWDDLLAYMDGSAAVIGEMMLPILEPTEPERAHEPARALGLAFQLTNFLRDIDEDLALGRTYLPREDLERYGVDLAQREVTPDFVRLMQFEIGRCRGLYAAAREGLAYLPPRSRRCIAAATRIYGAILDEIERNDFDVFSSRATVQNTRKARLLVSQLVRR